MLSPSCWLLAAPSASIGSHPAAARACSRNAGPGPKAAAPVQCSPFHVAKLMNSYECPMKTYEKPINKGKLKHSINNLGTFSFEQLDLNHQTVLIMKHETLGSEMLWSLNMWIQKTANTNLYQGKITISFIKHGTKNNEKVTSMGGDSQWFPCLTSPLPQFWWVKIK